MQPPLKKFQQIIWIADCSGSMAHKGKIESLNNFIREAISHFVIATTSGAGIELRMRAVKYSDTAQWHQQRPRPVKDYKWQNVSAGGFSNLGAAFYFLVDRLTPFKDTPSALPPALILVSDGFASDSYRAGLELLLQEQPTRDALRLAVAIGADADERTLEEFIANPAKYPIRQTNPQAIVVEVLTAMQVYSEGALPGLQRQRPHPGIGESNPDGLMDIPDIF
jgi:uncharacterized protein YegL